MNFTLKYFLLIINIILNVKIVLSQKCEKSINDLKGDTFARDPLILRYLPDLNKYVLKAPANGRFEFKSGETFYTSCRNQGKLSYINTILNVFTSS